MTLAAEDVGSTPKDRAKAAKKQEKTGLLGSQDESFLTMGDSDEDYQAAMRASVPFIYFGAPKTGVKHASVPQISSWSSFGEAASRVLDHSAS